MHTSQDTGEDTIPQVDAAAAGKKPEPATSARSVPAGIVFPLAMLTALGPLSIDMYLPSLPAMVEDLGITVRAGQATLSTFFVGLAVGQLIFGPLSDRYGRRIPIIAGLCLYILASLICLLAPGIEVLLSARLAQAFGACAAMVIARAVVRDLFDHQESARFLSLLALVAGLAPILAPLLGSLLLHLGGWRTVFGALTLFGLAACTTVLLRLSESRSEATAIQARGEHPAHSYWQVLSRPRFLAYFSTGALNGACMFTYISSSSPVFIDVYGISPTHFSLLFGFNALGLVSGFQLNRLFLRRSPADLVLARVTVFSACFAVLLLWSAVSGMGGVWGLVIPLFFTIASSSLIQANSMAGALSVDPSRAGVASALFGAGSFTSGALAATVAGALYNDSAVAMAGVIAVCMVTCATATGILWRVGNRLAAG